MQDSAESGADANRFTDERARLMPSVRSAGFIPLHRPSYCELSKEEGSASTFTLKRDKSLAPDRAFNPSPDLRFGHQQFFSFGESFIELADFFPAAARVLRFAAAFAAHYGRDGLDDFARLDLFRKFR